MNLTVNNVMPPINYTNKKLQKINKDVQFNLEIDDKKISEEEDNLLYEVYKKSHMAHSAKSFEQFKKDNLTFPPDTAPGIVRKIFREKWQNSTDEEKKSLLGIDTVYSMMLGNNSEYKKNMPNDLNGYIKFIENMHNYIDLHYKGVPGLEKFYQGLIDVTNSVETELNKYK